MTRVVLAVDLGGTKTAAALVDLDGRILVRSAVSTRGSDGPDAIIDGVLTAAGTVLSQKEGAVLAAVGVGTAGVVDTRTGSILSATDTLARWAGTNVAARVRDGLGDALAASAPVRVVNDVDAHAAGEHRFGAGRGTSSALVVGVGTGVGAGVVIDGHVLRGAHGVAGELAHMPITGADHLLCPCGRPGHLEAIGAGLGLHAHYLSLGGDASIADTRGVAVAAAAGDALAVQAIADSASAVGRAIAGACTLIDPEIVILTGGVADIGDLWSEPLRAAFRATAIDVLQDLPLVAGTLGGDAPLLGAAAEAIDQL